MPELSGEQVTAPETKTMRIVSCPWCDRVICEAEGRLKTCCQKCGTWFEDTPEGQPRILKAGDPRLRKAIPDNTVL